MRQNQEKETKKREVRETDRQTYLTDRQGKKDNWAPTFPQSMAPLNDHNHRHNNNNNDDNIYNNNNTTTPINNNK